MTGDRYDPANREQWEARYNEACRQFTAREFPMTLTVFRVTLYGLGFRGQALESEVNLSWPPCGPLTVARMS